MHQHPAPSTDIGNPMSPPALSAPPRRALPWWAVALLLALALAPIIVIATASPPAHAGTVPTQQGLKTPDTDKLPPESAPTVPWIAFGAGKAVYCTAEAGCVAMSIDTLRQLMQEAQRIGGVEARRTCGRGMAL